MVIRAVLLPVVPVVPPSVHDEFSELLLADTFASGRLTNPTHPLWQHFESIHVIQRPTYNSMYQPAFGAFLALGQKITGNPWAGVWLSTGLMCAAICWMLQGWLPPVWALVGGLLAVFTIGIPSYWMNSYIGGSVPALGGALVMGALGRLTRVAAAGKPSAWSALAMGVGFALLLGSRPFEGGVLGLVTAVALLTSWWKQHALWHRLLSLRLILPFLLVMVPAVAFTGYYSWRVTGNPLKMPYEVNRETYGWPENLAILPPVRVTYRHSSMKAMHLVELEHRQVYSKFGRTVDTLIFRFLTAWKFYIGPVLTVPFLFLPLAIQDRRTRVPALIALFMCALNLLQLMLYPQHISAITSVIFLLLTQGLRHLRVALVTWRPAIGPRFAVALSLAVLMTSGVRLLAEPLGTRPDFWEVPRQDHRDYRAAIVSRLTGRSRPQLVVVRYRIDHTPHQEWIYNRADIDKSKIVWAHEMDPASNRTLLRYFAGREAWLLEADGQPPRLVPYPQTCQLP
jgi:MFS family permease